MSVHWVPVSGVTVGDILPYLIHIYTHIAQVQSHIRTHHTQHVCAHTPRTLEALLSPLSEVSPPPPAAQMRSQSSICPHSEPGPPRPLLFLFNDIA